MDENNNVVVRVPEQQFVRGEDGYSPVVTVEEIEHGHSVNITDREHPEGQSFDVLDGASAYEQAVAGGYTGTEAQFNAELAAFKDLSDETKEAAPFYAEYGVTTKAQIESAINNKRQIYLLTALLVESTPQAYVMPLTEKFEYQYTDGGLIVIGRGYRFSITSGTNQYIAELANGWTAYTNDLSAPADRAEEAAQQALNRMNSADQSAQNAAGSASDASRDAGTASTAATTATTKAGEASDSATAADGSAKDAEAYAVGKRGGTDVGSTDPAYHNNAKYYAEQAASSASDAVTAKGAAETAQGKAEDAQEAAETAQGAAEQAQSDAEAAAQSVSQSAAQIEQNRQDIGDLKSAINSVEFDYLSQELKDDVLHREDIFPHNLAKWQIGSLDQNGNPATSSTSVRTIFLEVLPNTTYNVVFADPENISIALYEYNDQQSYIANTRKPATSRTNVDFEFTTDPACKYIRLYAKPALSHAAPIVLEDTKQIKMRIYKAYNELDNTLHTLDALASRAKFCGNGIFGDDFYNLWENGRITTSSNTLVWDRDGDIVLLRTAEIKYAQKAFRCSIVNGYEYCVFLRMNENGELLFGRTDKNSGWLTDPKEFPSGFWYAFMIRKKNLGPSNPQNASVLQIEEISPDVNEGVFNTFGHELIKKRFKNASLGVIDAVTHYRSYTEGTATRAVTDFCYPLPLRIGDQVYSDDPDNVEFVIGRYNDDYTWDYVIDTYKTDYTIEADGNYILQVRLKNDGEITDIEAVTSKIHVSVNSLDENGKTRYGTPYHDSEDLIVQKVLTDRDSNTLTFAVITDIHYAHSFPNDTEEHIATLKNLPAINRIAERTASKFIVDLGDTIHGYGATLQDNFYDAQKLWSMHDDTFIPVLYTIAHHEQYGASREYRGADAVSMSQNLGIYGFSTKNLDVHYSANKNHWYVDIDGVRFLGVDSTSRGARSIDPFVDVPWLTNILDDTNSPVIAFTHIPFRDGVSWKNLGDQNASGLEASLNQNGCVAVFHGHTHWDNIYKYDDLNFPYISTQCALPVRADMEDPEQVCRDGTPTAANRALNTYSQYTFDIVNYHTDTHVFKMFRFGAGSDRVYDPN